MFGAYVLIATFYPWFDLLMYLVVLPAVVPWIVVRALRFSRRVSSHRNIRFGFVGTMREVFMVYVVFVACAILTAGLLYPHAVYRHRRYLVENSRFGQTPFRFHGSARSFYGPYAYVFGVGLAVVAIILGIIVCIVLCSSRIPPEILWAVYQTEATVLLVLTAVAALLVAAAYLSTRIENYAWNHTLLGADRFSMDLEFGRMLWIYLSNALAIVATVGLMIPWAQVRLARYRLSRLRLQTVAGLDGHVAAGRDTASATGQELGDAFDVDIAL